MTRTTLRFRGPAQLELGEEPMPGLADGEALVDVLAVGLCGTDAHILDGSFAAETGVILGHEVCGVVREIPGDVPGIAVGDLVAIEPHAYCTICTYCRSGEEHLCESKRGYGVRLDGGLTTTMAVPARILYRLDPRMSPLLGAMAEPLACCIHAMDRLGPRPGESILIAGCGPAGAMLVALSKAHGLGPIVVSEPSASRRELALAMGCDVAVHPDELDGGEVLELTSGRGFASVVDAVGRGAIASSLLRHARRGGRLLIFGVAAPDDGFRLSPREVYERELTILGSVINPYTHERAVAMLPRLPLQRIPSRVHPLSAFAEAFRAQGDGQEKVYISPRPDALEERIAASIPA